MPHGIDSGYRNKAVLYFEESAGTRKLGMYEAGSHHVAPGTDSCRLCPNWMAEAANAVLHWSKDSGLSVWSESSQTGLLRGLILRSGSSGRLATLVTSSSIPDSASENLIPALQSAGVTDVTVSIKTRPGNFVLGERAQVLLGRGSITAEISGLEFEVRPETFLQVNTPQTPVLYDTAIRLASIDPEDTVLDLYSGIGTISLLLARKAGHVIGVEIVPESVEEAKKNAVRNGLSNTEFSAARQRKSSRISTAAASSRKRFCRPFTKRARSLCPWHHYCHGARNRDLYCVRPRGSGARRGEVPQPRVLPRYASARRSVPGYRAY